MTLQVTNRSFLCSGAEWTSPAGLRQLITVSQAVLYGDTQILWKGKIHLKLGKIEVLHFSNRARPILLHRYSQKYMSNTSEVVLYCGISTPVPHLKPETMYKMSFSFSLKHICKAHRYKQNHTGKQPMFITNLYSALQTAQNDGYNRELCLSHTRLLFSSSPCQY